MRAREFIKEAKIDRLPDDDTYPMPATWVIPALKNQDPYLQYRFGCAIASAKGRKQREQDGVHVASKASELGENEIVVSFDPHVADYIDDALTQMGIPTTNKRLVSTVISEDPPDTNTVSPLPGFDGYQTKRKNK